MALGGDGTSTNTGSQSAVVSGGQHASYSGSGSYVVSAAVGATALSGGGTVTESAARDWGYGFASQSTENSDGAWPSATGSGGTTATGSIQWAYSASGDYTRPLDGGALSGTWQANGGSSGGHTAKTASTLNPDGSWTTTGTANSSGSGSGGWDYSGSGSYSQSTSTGDSSNGSDSSFSSQASEAYGQGGSSQYAAVSTLAANGSVTTVTTGSASGGASGNHTYSSSGASASWSQTGDYAAGDGTASGASASSGLSLTESMQSQWQENYTITAGPTGTTTTGGASANGQASGAASWYNSGSGFTESDGSSSGYSFASGNNWASGASGQDNYNDQTSWSEPYNLVGSSSGSSSGTTVDHVWGSATNTWSSGTWSSSQGYGSGSGSGFGNGSGSSTSFSTSSSGSSGYDLDVSYSGFYQGAGYSGMGAGADAGWVWGVGWAGAGTNGPLGPSAFSGVGYAFTPGDPVSVTQPGDQSNTEGDSVSLQIQKSDWSAASGSASGSGSGGGWSASGLPAGLAIDAATGLITGTIQPGDAANGPYSVTVTYTDGAGNSGAASFVWNVSPAVGITDPGDQSSTEGAAVSLQVQATDAKGGTLTYSEVGLPPGLSINTTTGQITGTIAAGDAATGTFVATITADDGTYTSSQTVYWNVAAAPASAPPLGAVLAAPVNALAGFLYGGLHCLDQKIASLRYSIGYGSSSTYPRPAVLPAPGVLVRTAGPSPGLRVCGANKNAFPDRQRGVSPGTLPGASAPPTTGAVVPRCRT